MRGEGWGGGEVLVFLTTFPFPPHFTGSGKIHWNILL